jgi:hypothetical protein
MSYVAAAWLSCAAVLAAYVARTVRRERGLRKFISSEETDKWD